MDLATALTLAIASLNSFAAIMAAYAALRRASQSNGDNGKRNGVNNATSA